MIKHGVAPYLECSTRGDKRFSAFYARPSVFKGKSIEELYQGAKIFDDGTGPGLTWKEAKGKKAKNHVELAEWYGRLWDIYIMEHPELFDVLTTATGLSDMFGQEGHVCQATELWRIRNDLIRMGV